jgi:hypothetical protein
LHTSDITADTAAELEFHPLANVFPLIEGPDFDALVADIKANGVREPIWLYQDLILDGRNRHRAALAAGVECPTQTYDGDDPLAFVISANLHRRHLNESQRGMVAARLATLKQGARTDLSPIGEMSQQQAATLFKIGKRSVERANEVLNSGTPALIAAVERGDIAVSQAAKLSHAGSEFQEAVVAKIAAEDIKPQEAIRRVKAATIEAKRIVKPTGKYRIIYADPPWSYGNSQQDEFHEQRDHYPVMELARIMQRFELRAACGAVFG